jgi:DNA-binding NtrC family response regulator
MGVAASILIVDDEEAMRLGLAEALKSHGFTVRTCGSASEARSAMNDEVFDVVITDLVMPGDDGMSLLEWVGTNHEDVPVIMITGFSTVATAVEAMQKGAHDYISKPFNLDEVRMTVLRAAERRKLSRENEALRRQVAQGRGTGGLVFADHTMTRLMETVGRVADSALPVLIIGETGTGKELVARELHERSDRRHGPMMSVNCAALTDTLLESELFGHARGAFTGADKAREGLFQAADGGTIFLDEIGDMAESAQARLLRVLQEGEVRRVGENASRRIDVRVTAATNRDLAELIRAGRFREDLFYRLNVVTLEIPPLRARIDDVPALAEMFVTRAGMSGIDADAMDALRAYDWPGNVRELENICRRGSVLARGNLLTPAELPEHIASGRFDTDRTAAENWKMSNEPIFCES